MRQELYRRGIEVFAVSGRSMPVAPDPHATWLSFGPAFDAIPDRWPTGIDGVVHLAARVHHMHEKNSNTLQLYRAVNRDATIRIAQAAAAQGINRFVFLSSIKALGEHDQGVPLRETDSARPADPYGISKHEGELALNEMSSATFLPTILRIPLVYGPGVQANFASLAKAVRRGIPLPLGNAVAPRSMIGMENLIDAIIATLEHPKALGQLFHVADDETLSVRELIQALAKSLDRRARLIDVPLPALNFAALALGKTEQVSRLTSSLRLDTAKIQSTLGWRPPHSVYEGLQRACRTLI